MSDKCPNHVRRRRGCPTCERISAALAESSFAAPSGSANTPLKAEVKDKILTVQIGIETLEWASKPENGGPLEGCKVDGRRRLDWANDVVREMTRENEIGESPLGKFLDSMMEAAANNGSTALCWPNEKVSYHADNAGGAHGKDSNDK